MLINSVKQVGMVPNSTPHSTLKLRPPSFVLVLQLKKQLKSRKSNNFFHHSFNGNDWSKPLAMTDIQGEIILSPQPTGTSWVNELHSGLVYPKPLVVFVGRSLIGSSCSHRRSMPDQMGCSHGTWLLDGKRDHTRSSGAQLLTPSLAVFFNAGWRSPPLPPGLLHCMDELLMAKRLGATPPSWSLDLGQCLWEACPKTRMICNLLPLSLDVVVLAHIV